MHAKRGFVWVLIRITWTKVHNLKKTLIKVNKVIKPCQRLSKVLSHAWEIYIVNEGDKTTACRTTQTNCCKLNYHFAKNCVKSHIIAYKVCLSTSVAVCNCWRPNLCYCWCSAVEQSTTRHYRMWHSTTVWTQNILVSTVIPIYCVLVCCGLRFVVVPAVFT